MFIKVFVLVSYVAGLFVIGWWARTRWSDSAESYFLAGRSLSPIIFLATMAATNFSAFTVFGCSGAGYRDGYAFYPIIGFGTGFMAITFWTIGRRVRELGQSSGALTPPDLVRAAYNSRGVSTLVAVVMIIFTIPYLALQPIAAGYALQELLGLNYLWGAVLVTAVVTIYTLRGGLKAVARTDALQGLIMLSVLLAALILVANQSGGLITSGRKLMSQYPELFSRPGGQGRYLPAIWFSFIFLWFFCDPMFPQLFQRFLAARDNRTIRRTMLAYPFVCSVVFLLPVTIGVLGRLNHPGLTGKEADRILPLLAAGFDSPALGALVVACGLAALMSTMDSQLLTLSSIFSQDLYSLVRKKKTSSGVAARLFVILLALAGLGLAIRPPGTILAIARQTFTGLAVLFPTVLFGLYPGWRSKSGAIVSIIVGESALLLAFFGHLPTWGFLSVVPILALTFGSYLIVAGIERALKKQPLAWPAAFLRSPYTWAFLAIFVLAVDWYRWEESPALILGWPVWVIHFLVLSAAQTLIMARWARET
ncbi:MAG: sodium:solute symporter family protein [Deltaproteobacteria bacterium]|nr:sodium:solute symporter family protein [Deltaproteobacteria bacterium]MBW2052299.1 sodium:solute symporter family protein [Deltaproteobacteria bacterium]MBW2139755.1 sodium:solute symporter family protein [Deltaproteobacteria bacterium]MBW2323000.1 sodium:solute symporter family protein [Deltaproteobacteria bacterium]